MKLMNIVVISARRVNGQVRAVVCARHAERATIHLVLSFAEPVANNLFEAAYDEALKYLDVA